MPTNVNGAYIPEVAAPDAVYWRPKKDEVRDLYGADTTQLPSPQDKQEDQGPLAHYPLHQFLLDEYNTAKRTGQKAIAPWEMSDEDIAKSIDRYQSGPIRDVASRTVYSKSIPAGDTANAAIDNISSAYANDVRRELAQNLDAFKSHLRTLAPADYNPATAEKSTPSEGVLGDLATGAGKGAVASLLKAGQAGALLGGGITQKAKELAQHIGLTSDTTPSSIADALFGASDTLAKSADETMKGVPDTKSGKIGSFIGGLPGGVVSAPVSFTTTGQDVLRGGGTLAQAEAANALSGAATAAGGAIGKLGSSAATRALLQGSANTALGEGSRVLENAVLPENMQRPFDPLMAGMNFGAGAALSRLLPSADKNETPPPSETPPGVVSEEKPFRVTGVSDPLDVPPALRNKTSVAGPDTSAEPVPVEQAYVSSKLHEITGGEDGTPQERWESPEVATEVRRVLDAADPHGTKSTEDRYKDLQDVLEAWLSDHDLPSDSVKLPTMDEARAAKGETPPQAAAPEEVAPPPVEAPSEPVVPPEAAPAPEPVGTAPTAVEPVKAAPAAKSTAVGAPKITKEQAIASILDEPITVAKTTKTGKNHATQKVPVTFRSPLDKAMYSLHRLMKETDNGKPIDKESMQKIKLLTEYIQANGVPKGKQALFMGEKLNDVIEAARKNPLQSKITVGLKRDTLGKAQR